MGSVGSRLAVLGLIGSIIVTSALFAAAITGTEGNDHITPTVADPALRTTEEADTVSGLGGDDDIRTAGGNDTVDGGAGDDGIYGGDGDDTLSGGEGDDSLHGEAGSDILDGGEGDDTLIADIGNPSKHGDDTLRGGNGNDTLRGGFGADLLDGGEGDDDLKGDAGDDTLEGGGGDDELDGGAGNDLLHGHHGDDTITGGEDRDLIYGDDGDDELRGYEDSDYLDGGNGEDVLDGEGGSDLLIGRDGNDTLITGGGDDYIAIIGNSVEGYTIHDDLRTVDGVEEPIDSGDDMICFVRDVNPDQMTWVSLPPHNKIYLEFDNGYPTAGAVNLDLATLPGLRHIEAFRTGSGNDVIRGTDSSEGPGNAYNARFYGIGAGWLHVHELFFTGEGDDTIETRAGNDLVDAGAGNDTIILGPGEHFVTTGPGADTVRLDAAEFNGQGGTYFQNPRCKFVDLEPGDQILISGDVTPAAFRMAQSTWPGQSDVGEDPYRGAIWVKVSVNGREEFDILGVRMGDIAIGSNVGGGVKITVRRRVNPADIGVPGHSGPVKDTGGVKEGVGGGKTPRVPPGR